LKQRRTIRAVSFDVGGTLIEPWPSVGHVYANVAARFGIEGVAPEELNRRFVAAWQARHDFDYSRAAWRELVNASFAGVCQEAPSLECFEAMYEAFGRPVSWRVFEDVMPTLAAVRGRGWKLAIVSNWDERLRPLLHGLGLLNFFDVVVVSHEVGSAKPSPHPFLRAASELKLPAECLLHIGDSDREDCGGARAAGWDALLLDRRRQHADPCAVDTLAAVLDCGAR
jgi:putative hydrolase of the HAD superfamily